MVLAIKCLHITFSYGPGKGFDFPMGLRLVDIDMVILMSNNTCSLRISFTPYKPLQANREDGNDNSACYLDYFKICFYWLLV